VVRWQLVWVPQLLRLAQVAALPGAGHAAQAEPVSLRLLLLLGLLLVSCLHPAAALPACHAAVCGASCCLHPLLLLGLLLLCHCMCPAAP
jgi:hypothetical protein